MQMKRERTRSAACSASKLVTRKNGTRRRRNCQTQVCANFQANGARLTLLSSWFCRHKGAEWRYERSEMYLNILGRFVPTFVVR